MSLYAVNSSVNGTHSTLSGSNASILQRVTTPWNENTVTWNTAPQITTKDEVMVPASVAPLQDFPNIDITTLVQDMVDQPDSSYGLLFRIDTESYYRRLVFASSDYPDTSLHPKLVVQYTTPSSDTA